MYMYMYMYMHSAHGATLYTTKFFLWGPTEVYRNNGLISYVAGPYL